MKSIPKPTGTYPNRLDALRLEKGWSKLELSRQLYGWNANHIHDLIRGRRLPGKKMKARFPIVFDGLTFDEIYGGEL